MAKYYKRTVGFMDDTLFVRVDKSRVFIVTSYTTKLAKHITPHKVKGFVARGEWEEITEAEAEGLREEQAPVAQQDSASPS